MKALIWIGCIFVATILNTLLGELTGIKIGYLLFYFGVYFVARKLCEKWDEHKASKTKRNEQRSGGDADGNHVRIASQVGIGSGINCSATELTNKICFCRKCGKKLIDESRFCCKCGTQVVDKMVSTE